MYMHEGMIIFTGKYRKDQAVLDDFSVIINSFLSSKLRHTIPSSSMAEVFFIFHV